MGCSANHIADQALRKALDSLRERAGAMGLTQIATLASTADAAIRLGADRIIVRKAIDEAVNCARRTDGYNVAREPKAA